MMKIDDFKAWIKKMQHLGTISGGTSEKVLEFVDSQQQEIDKLKQKIKKNNTKK